MSICENPEELPCSPERMLSSEVTDDLSELVIDPMRAVMRRRSAPILETAPAFFLVPRKPLADASTDAVPGAELPRARSRLWQFASTWCDRPDLGTLRGKVSLVSIEDLLGAMQNDAHSAGTDPRPFQAAALSYLAPAG